MLIADSGSTKTDWAYIDNNHDVTEFHSKGMNPFNITTEDLRLEIEQKVLPNIKDKHISNMYFYGSGCQTQKKQQELKNVFSLYLPNTNINIQGDLLASARATCGHKAGISAILGTGSNSCVYDGENIIANIPSLGYVLCDEGAGTNIGKLVLRSYLRYQMPKDLAIEFSKLYPGQTADFLDRLYKGPVPNYYLASFAKFAITRKDNDFCKNMIQEAFESFFIMQITKYEGYKQLPISVVGSVGYYARDIFISVAKSFDTKVDKIIKAPMDELIQYHLNN